MSIKEDIVGVEIGVEDTGVVEFPDTAADGQPDSCWLRALFEPVGQGAGLCDAFGDQVRPVDAQAGDNPRRYWSGHRETLGVERRQQTPLPPGAGMFRVHSQIMVVKEFGDQTAATVMPQHPILPLIAKKIGFAPAESFANQKAARGKLFGTENVVGRLCNPHGIV